MDWEEYDEYDDHPPSSSSSDQEADEYRYATSDSSGELARGRSRPRSPGYADISDEEVISMAERQVTRDLGSFDEPFDSKARHPNYWLRLQQMPRGERRSFSPPQARRYSQSPIRTFLPSPVRTYSPSPTRTDSLSPGDDAISNSSNEQQGYDDAISSGSDEDGYDDGISSGSDEDGYEDLASRLRREPLYETLPYGWFRLLFIHPAPYVEADIECTLQPYPVSHAPRHSALSYTWGDPREVR